MPILLALLFYACVLVGCHRPESFNTSDEFISPITSADITYTELAERYNEKVEPFNTLWTRTNIDIEWYEVDEDGDRNYRSESGEGKFIFRRPGDTALLVEKLGKVYLWAGSDATHYWLFDMVDSDNKTAYVGEFAKLDQPGRISFPLPVRPDTVPSLLGLMPLPSTAVLGHEPPVDLYNAQYLVELPGMRLLIDPRTFRPTRVDLTNAQGYSVLTSKLQGMFPVEVQGVEDRLLPNICDRAEIYVSGFDSRLTVEMDFATADPRRVRDQMFDFETLSKAHKPKTIKSLDRD